MNTHKKEIEYQFDLSIVTSKYQRKLEQQNKERNQDANLIDSVRKRDFKSIANLLETGSDIESIETKMYMRPSHIACELGDVELCRYLDSQGCDWNSLDKEQQTPIFYAVNSGNLEVVKYLVEEKHVDHSPKEYQDRTPFYLACFLGHIDIIRYLYQKGVNINQPSKLKRCALSKACYLGHIEVVKFLVNCPEIILTLPDSKGRTPMHNAAWGNEGGKEGKRRGTIILPDSPESIKILHDYGHPIDFEDFEGVTPLMSAASSNAIDSVRVLIARGANSSFKNVYGETSVFLAAKFGHLNVLKILIEELSVNWETEDKQGTSAVQIAGIQQKFDCLEYLLQYEKKNGKLKVEEFISKINDEYLTKDEQVRVFQKYNELVDCSAHVKDIEKLGQFMEKCTNIELVKSVIKVIVNKLSSEQIQKFISSIITNEYIKSEVNTEDQALVEIVRKDQLENLIQMYELLQKEVPEKMEKIEIPIDSTFKLLEKGNLSEENTCKLLFELNLNWFDFRDAISKCNNNTVLHMLCEKRQTAVLVELTEIIRHKNEEIPFASNKWKNQFIRNHSTLGTIEFVREIFQRKNDESLNVLDTCLISRALDLHHILSSFLRRFLNEEPLCYYSTIKYKMEVIEEKTRIVEHAQRIELTEKAELLAKLIKDKSDDLKSHNFYSQDLSLDKIVGDKERRSIFIDDLKNTDCLLSQINDCNVFGIDLEYYTQTSPTTGEADTAGFVCTLQISTPSTDFIIDAIKLRENIKGLLNSSLFNNQNKLKIFHGCDNDLKWLKSDFDIDVVELFDTNKAEMILSNQVVSFSLKQVVQKELNIALDKSFQLADWRIRPLPINMLSYASVDSKILLPLYSILKQQLKDKQFLPQMYLGSLRLLLKKYEVNKRVILQVDPKSSVEETEIVEKKE